MKIYYYQANPNNYPSLMMKWRDDVFSCSYHERVLAAQHGFVVWSAVADIVRHARNAVTSRSERPPMP